MDQSPEPRREFSLRNDVSNKFWTILRSGPTVITTSGRIGHAARTTETVFDTDDEAEIEAERMVRKKLRKGYAEGYIASLPPWRKPEWESIPMSEETFWRVLALFDWKKLGDDDAVVRRAVSALSAMKPDDIALFDDILAEKLHSLDTGAHCAAAYGRPEADLDREYISPDDFLYVRCAALTSGPERFEEILESPSTMPQDVEFEALLYVASEAFEMATGEDYSHIPSTPIETFSNSLGWP
ncbi:DUF4240 domain-containing protein [Cnuibacter sp. UC19_7]|uniref:DUF4240 domain-containing protein n=1 Tax=Cnuibacter sp. UC19_7 TaxID=3350166 RepID=UPI003671DCF2